MQVNPVLEQRYSFMVTSMMRRKQRWNELGFTSPGHS